MSTEKELLETTKVRIKQTEERLLNSSGKDEELMQRLLGILRGMEVRLERKAKL